VAGCSGTFLSVHEVWGAINTSNSETSKTPSSQYEQMISVKDALDKHLLPSPTLLPAQSSSLPAPYSSTLVGTGTRAVNWNFFFFNAWSHDSMPETVKTSNAKKGVRLLATSMKLLHKYNMRVPLGKPNPRVQKQIII